jgi:hypothetical protein
MAGGSFGGSSGSSGSSAASSNTMGAASGNPISIVFGAATFIAGAKARKKRRQARKLQRILNTERFRIQKRSFLQRFRAIQAEQVLAGSREGGLRSSAFQGQQASLRTQKSAELGIFEDRTRIDVKRADLINTANRKLETAEFFSSFGQTATDLGNTARENPTPGGV